jgi:putative ATPase
MKKMGYGADYKYAHDYPGNFVRQQYLPDALASTRFWHPCQNPAEDRASQLQASRWSTPEQ